jgi:hypothetical protein
MGVRANSSMSDLVTSGAISALPRLTTRTASASCSGGVFFNKNPLAPARRASNTYSSSRKVVTTITWGPSAATIRRVASIPSRPGMRMSMSTMSATPVAANSTAA